MTIQVNEHLKVHVLDDTMQLAEAPCSYGQTIWKGELLFLLDQTAVPGDIILVQDQTGKHLGRVYPDEQYLDENCHMQPYSKENSRFVYQVLHTVARPLAAERARNS